MTDAALTFAMIEEARERIGDRVYKTPFPMADKLSGAAGGKVYMKLENLQRSGSFKERGAANKLLMLSKEERDNGVVAASAGNHAQGVAMHASRLGIPATIVMPDFTPLVKVTRTRKLGAEVVLHGANYDDAYALACEICDDRGATFVHAFDDLAIIAGQGTIGLEILEQNPYLNQLIVPVGGGGLISGVAVAIKETNPRIKIIGVESDAYASMAAARKAGGPTTIDASRSIADGIAVRRVGNLTYDLVERYVDDLITVTEEEIANAILVLLEDEKVVAEGAGAAGVAAILSGRLGDLEGRKTGTLVCGGNIDINLVSQIIERGLVKAGRRIRLEIVIPDAPGALGDLTKILGETRANILEIHHDRTYSGVTFGMTDVVVALETKGYDHVAEIRERLEDEGYLVRR